MPGLRCRVPPTRWIWQQTFTSHSCEAGSLRSIRGLRTSPSPDPGGMLRCHRAQPLAVCGTGPAPSRVTALAWFSSSFAGVPSLPLLLALLPLKAEVPPGSSSALFSSPSPPSRWVNSSHPGFQCCLCAGASHICLTSALNPKCTPPPYSAAPPGA